ncbi:hypothetical protein JR731_005027, partial [Escherichia coli]|nr:hypothetical protein [Escherichia coli]
TVDYLAVAALLVVFPAPAGINRRFHAVDKHPARVPRASGDKPGCHR